MQEYYADFLAVNPDLASLNVPSTAGLCDPSRWDQPSFDRIQQGVCALLLALKKRPLIRYTSKSEAAMRLAESVLSTIDTEADLFAFRKPEVPPLLLLLDRRDDRFGYDALGCEPGPHELVFIPEVVHNTVLPCTNGVFPRRVPYSEPCLCSAWKLPPRELPTELVE